MAGLDGISHERPPGDRLDINMYEEGRSLTGVRKLPQNLLDALRALEASGVFRKALGDAFVDSYLKLKLAEWHEYSADLTPWERAHTLDC